MHEVELAELEEEETKVADKEAGGGVRHRCMWCLNSTSRGWGTNLEQLSLVRGRRSALLESHSGEEGADGGGDKDP